MQPLHHNLQKRRRKELQRIPNQRAIERALLERQRPCEKLLNLSRIGLVVVEIAITETGIQLMDKIIRVETMPVIRDEAHSRLAGTRKIEDGQPGALFKRCAELIQSVTVTILQI